MVRLFPQKVQVQVQVHMPKMMQPTPDDKKVMQQILAGHSPDASLLVDENALLTMAQDILSKATPTLPLVISKSPCNLYSLKQASQVLFQLSPFLLGLDFHSRS